MVWCGINRFSRLGHLFHISVGNSPHENGVSDRTCPASPGLARQKSQLLRMTSSWCRLLQSPGWQTHFSLIQPKKHSETATLALCSSKKVRCNSLGNFEKY